MKKSKKIEVKTKYTKEGFQTFNRSHYQFMMRRKKWWFIAFLILSIPLLVLAVWNGIELNFPFIILFLLIDAMIIVEVFTNILPDLQVKRMIKNDETILNIENTYVFFDDYFTVTNINGKNEIKYETLYQAIETKTSLYIYMNKQAAFLLDKNDVGESEFNKIKEKLTTHLEKKYYIR